MTSIRIDKDSIRFRISPVELEKLLEGESLPQYLMTGGRNIEYSISPTQEGKMQLDTHEMKLSLLVPQRDIESLRDMGRSKKGISIRQGSAEVSLQVDLKMQKRDIA